MFDPYMDEISEYAAMGMTVREIAERIEHYFDDVISDDSLHSFMRYRGIRSMVTQGGKGINKAPICDRCKNCIVVKNTSGKDIRVCLSIKKIVSKSCKTSPIECKKRLTNIQQTR